MGIFGFGLGLGVFLSSFCMNPLDMLPAVPRIERSYPALPLAMLEWKTAPPREGGGGGHSRSSSGCHRPAASRHRR